MASFSSFLLVVVGLMVVLGLFFGYIRGLSGSFRKNPTGPSLQSSKLKDKQSDLARETEEKRKQVMEDLQQKIKDNQKKF